MTDRVVWSLHCPHLGRLADISEDPGDAVEGGVAAEESMCSYWRCLLHPPEVAVSCPHVLALDRLLLLLLLLGAGQRHGSWGWGGRGVSVSGSRHNHDQSGLGGHCAVWIDSTSQVLIEL